MAKFHVNPNSGLTGPCSAHIRCPFGGEEAHYDSAAEARKAYEATQNTFKPEVKLQAVPTPTESYLEPSAAREMWARGARIERHSTPPDFGLKKSLSTSQGFMAGAIYSHSINAWQPASFTPDGKLAFVDTNRSFSGRPELAIRRWDEDNQSWTHVGKRNGGNEYDIAVALSGDGYNLTRSGMISARDVRTLKAKLSEIGERRPSSGEIGRGSHKPEVLATPDHIVKASQERAEAVLYSLGGFADDLEGSVPDPDNYRRAADTFLEEAEDRPENITAKQLWDQAREWSRSNDPYDSFVGQFIVDEMKRKQTP